MSTAVRRSFAAHYEGSCGTCPATIAVGDAVFYPQPGSALVSGLDCCGDRPDEDLAPTVRADDHLALDDEDAVVAIARVLPRGRDRADMCDRCWQIPANNGACGCDY